MKYEILHIYFEILFDYEIEFYRNEPKYIFGNINVPARRQSFPFPLLNLSDIFSIFNMTNLVALSSFQLDEYFRKSRLSIKSFFGQSLLDNILALTKAYFLY